MGDHHRHPDLMTLSTFLLSLSLVLAGPYPRDHLHDVGFSFLQDRSCQTYCGVQNQYCCIVGEACYTNQANIAFCSAGLESVTDGFAVYTTTYTETNLILRTSTYTSSWTISTPTSQPHPIISQLPICTSSLGESSCGEICCASDQRCAFINSCTAYTTLAETTSCTTFLPPFRPTSGDLFTTSATTTVPFLPPATASGSIFPVTTLEGNNNLSGGVIAAIVLGVVVGVALLFLFCACCIKSFAASKKKERPQKTSVHAYKELPRKQRIKNFWKIVTGISIGALFYALLKSKLENKSKNLSSIPESSSRSSRSSISSQRRTEISQTSDSDFNSHRTRSELTESNRP